VVVFMVWYPGKRLSRCASRGWVRAAGFGGSIGSGVCVMDVTSISGDRGGLKAADTFSTVRLRA